MEEKLIEGVRISELKPLASIAGTEYLLVQDGSDNKKLLISALAKSDDLKTKVDAEEGKTLISVTELNRLANVNNYDDTELSTRVEKLESSIDSVSGSSDSDGVVDLSALNKVAAQTPLDVLSYMFKVPDTETWVPCVVSQSEEGTVQVLTALLQSTMAGDVATLQLKKYATCDYKIIYRKTKQ